MAKRRTYRVNTDSWTVLRDIMVGTPEDFNPNYSRKSVHTNGWSGYRYTGAFRGRRMTVGLLSVLGQLPDEWRALWHAHKGEIVYAIWSYETPIAWKLSDGTWHVPNVKYSVTTTKQQNKVATAISTMGSDD